MGFSTYERALCWLGGTALLPATATFYFWVFWSRFEFWRRHPTSAYAMIAASFGAMIAGIVVFSDPIFAGRLPMPSWIQALGWALLAAACVLGWIADRQLGFRVRSFRPFFETGGRIELRTTGAYGLVRHPIYTAGLGYQLGAFLVTGYPTVAVAAAVFGLGALWFTREEERRLLELLDDPSLYARYRARVPRLLPRPWSVNDLG